MKGYIKLYRKLLCNPIFKNPYLLQLFVYCLLKANHSEGKAFYGADEIEINPGQFVTGRFELSSALGENSSSTYKRLKRLESLHVLGLQSNNKNTLVTVLNWSVYQSSNTDLDNEVTGEGQQSNNKVTTKGQQSNNKVTQTRMKESKKERMQECKEDINSVFDHYCEVFQGYYKTLSLTPARIKHINARLERYSVEQIKLAITNIRTSKYHLGEEPNNDKFYATLEFICRNDETLEKWINHIPKKSGNANTNKALELYEQAKTEEGEPVW
jgi:hypothetical protein